MKSAKLFAVLLLMCMGCGHQERVDEPTQSEPASLTITPKTYRVSYEHQSTHDYPLGVEPPMCQRLYITWGVIESTLVDIDIPIVYDNQCNLVVNTEYKKGKKWHYNWEDAARFRLGWDDNQILKEKISAVLDSSMYQQKPITIWWENHVYDGATLLRIEWCND